jgi:hypothetical protein
MRLPCRALSSSLVDRRTSRHLRLQTSAFFFNFDQSFTLDSILTLFVRFDCSHLTQLASTRDIMAELWIQCFSCCFEHEPPRRKRRVRIDRSMIGNPTNFQHTAHVGTQDMSAHLSNLQNQMASKGGYEHALPVPVHIPVVDVQI